MRELSAWFAAGFLSFTGWLGSMTADDVEQHLRIVGAAVFILGGVISAVGALLAIRKTLRNK
jgi:hypothetical protein